MQMSLSIFILINQLQESIAEQIQQIMEIENLEEASIFSSSYVSMISKSKHLLNIWFCFILYSFVAMASPSWGKWWSGEASKFSNSDNWTCLIIFLVMIRFQLCSFHSIPHYFCPQNFQPGFSIHLMFSIIQKISMLDLLKGTFKAY